MCIGRWSALVLWVQLCNEDGGLEANGAHAGAVLEVPEHAFPVLAGAEQEAVVGGPAQRLDLARVAAQLAGNAVGLNVKYNDYAIMLVESAQAKAASGNRHGIPDRKQAGRRGD